MNRTAGVALLALALAFGCARKPATGAPATVRDYRCQTANAGETLHADCEFVDAGSEVRIGCAVAGRPLFALVGWQRRADLFVNADATHPAAHYALRHHGRFSPAVLRKLVDPGLSEYRVGREPDQIRSRYNANQDAGGPATTDITLPGERVIECLPAGAAESIVLPPRPGWVTSPATGSVEELRNRWIDAQSEAP